ncbi:MAG TPA: M48 family metalloprotease [Humisphaera sp.]|jgi:predicted Zn-dependent protease|nr:M48 family metalloprotease [Humisphaera sp.]
MYSGRIVNRLLSLALVTALALCAGVGCKASSMDSSVIDNANQFNTALTPAEVQQPQINEYFQAIGARIVAAAKEADRQNYGPKTHKEGKVDWMFQNVQFHLVNSKTLNAFTTGGDHVYVYNELFQLCQNEDQLAAVMSHEFGHIYSRHVQKGQSRQYALIAAALAAGGAGYLAGGKENGATYAGLAAGGAMAAGGFANMGFTRDDEAQADEMGFHFYYMAGWDPRHFGDFFQVMVDKGYDKTPEMLSDHPTLASRVKKAKERSDHLGGRATSLLQPNVATQEQFNQYKQLAQLVGASMPNDQQALANTKQLLQALPRSCVMPYEPKDQQDAQQEIMAKAQAAQQQQEAQQQQKSKKQQSQGSSGL